MKLPFLIKLVLFIIVGFISYFLFSFINYTLDISEWGYWGRVLFILLLIYLFNDMDNIYKKYF